jgi:hypothetical protein
MAAAPDCSDNKDFRLTLFNQLKRNRGYKTLTDLSLAGNLSNFRAHAFAFSW